MTGNFKFQLLFQDRIGIVFDIARLMTMQRLNIVSMEVEEKYGMAKISLEIERGNHPFDRQALLALCATLPGVQSSQELEMLPQERRQRWFRTLFDGMSEGIISVDAGGRINTINGVACRIINQVYESIIGRHISEVSPNDSILLDCLTKKVAISRRKSVLTGTGRVEFFGSAKPIFDEAGNLVGAVLLMQDLREVKEMVDAIVAPLPITFEDVIGRSPAIDNLITFAKKIADTQTIVSITGESGTGKELFARAIHFESGRSGSFVPINCAALPESLIESELFGYVDGAFTGARNRGKPGLFEAAGEGTIFLDEIGDMPLATQAKILRVLQEGSIRRIGGVAEFPVNARIITATNKDLKAMVQDKRFREDLYYRINVLTIQIPPLRERLMDIPLLAGEFLRRFAAKLGKSTQVLGDEALTKLFGHSWPGNIRELKNVIERASVLNETDTIAVESILLSHETIGRAASPPPVTGAEAAPFSLKDRVAGFESEILLTALNGQRSVRAAARALGLSHTALLKKIEKHRLISGKISSQWKRMEP